MLVERRLRLTTPLLAAKRSNNPEAPRRVFVRERRLPKGADPNLIYIRVQMTHWEWAFLEARDACELNDVSLGGVVPCRYFTTKGTSTYHRRFHRGSKPATEPFESVPGGQVVTLQFMLPNHLAPDSDGNGRFTRLPDEEEFDAMLAHIGEWIGMSEWGHKKGFGRFEIRPPITNGADAVGDTKQRIIGEDYESVCEEGE